ncbi:CopY/TcrY family copper transport repressor [Bombilactobacillus thymidiniphilus]|uniref:CopY/TcrY family copper transport repressor n=1 Tax=Bombilactobacillus thymidiniphilus TaxID=2923363 RepID=A0ABY4PDT1_9LACO|nr:CopY/TcrY family copper transport repressor [Bombilactobacillus thymidiniphilus]UQS83661.1 CopY/TcrY family copper transport repressor [Bombilactobacillus thymidiniphilus]
MTLPVDATEMTKSEWELMRIIWTKGQAGSSEISNLIRVKKDWTESTVKTLLRRLVSKQILKTTKDGRRFTYSPQITEGAAMDQLTDEMFSRMCDMKKGREIVKLIFETALSQDDIHAMQTILTEKIKTAPKQINCNCLPIEKNCCW